MLHKPKYTIGINDEKVNLNFSEAKNWGLNSLLKSMPEYPETEEKESETEWKF